MIREFGERALLVELDGSAEAQAFGASLLRARPAGVTAVVPGLTSVLVELDPAGDPDSVRNVLDDRLRVPVEIVGPGRRRRIPIVYGGEAGPDLDDCAAEAGLSAAEFAEAHASLELRVLFCGFAPGFAYLGNLPAALRVRRLATPRTHTPIGSVAVAGSMTGIYPAALPGGWRVIGRTPVSLFEPDRDPPAYLVPGDLVRFDAAGATSVELDAPRAAADW